MKRLRAWYRKQHFEPGPLGWVVSPFYFARRGLHTALVRLLPNLRGAVLDVGCGTKPYRAQVPATRYVGLDYDTPARRAAGFADVFYDGGRFPLRGGEFDGVLCTQVLEHVFTPEAFLNEINRVLRHGGVLVLTVPFVWDEHEQPYDFGRYSSFGLRALLERTGFEVLDLRKSCQGFSAIVQLTSGYVYKVTRSRSRWGGYLAQLFLIAPTNLIGAAVAWCLPRHGDIYLDNIVLARKP